MMKHMFALALLCAPAAALAQTAPAEGPVTVEIVTSGQVMVAAKHFRMSVTVTGKGADQAKASAALAAQRVKLGQTMAGLGVVEAKPGAGTPDSMMALFASMAGRSKPSFSLDTVTDDDNASPQSTASETVTYDAPSRAAVAAAKQAAEANHATVAEEVIALLDDYVAPTRLAKADALTKARAEASAYAATLGLRRVSITRISERQDIVAGSLGFVMQIFSMFAPKANDEADQVPVQANLTVEFALSR
jgi:uncharacterized protein YggE